MRIYSSFRELLSETCRELFARGQIAYDPSVQGLPAPRETHEMKEIVGYAYKLTGWSDMEEAMDEFSREFKKPHVKFEVAKRWVRDMRSVKNPDDWWKGFMDDYWEKYSLLPVWGRFEYTYGERLEPLRKGAVDKLRSNPFSRGAVLPVYYPSDVFQRVRVPCTLAYQFLIRPPRGYLIIYQRSCDFVNFFALDVAKAILYAEELLSEVGYKLTTVTHFIGSLHAYRVDVPERWRW